MTRKELQDYLDQFPAELPVRLLNFWGKEAKPQELTEDSFLLTSETAHHVEQPCEDGEELEFEIELGDGQQYLLINPIECDI